MVQDIHVNKFYSYIYILSHQYLSFQQKIPEGNVIVLHACAHNPTGVDPKV